MIQAPIVHLNGTSKQELLDQLQLARHVGKTFMDALQDARPHSRDYYPSGNDAYTKARDEAKDRELRVQSVLEELDQLYRSILQQGR